MAFVNVKSSQIHSLAYSPEDQVLTVRFLCGSCRGAGTKAEDACPTCRGEGHKGTYTYPNVSADKYAAIRDAESVGSVFHRLIKSNPAEHPHTRLA